MDRAERTGLWIAVIGHALLFGALSVSLLSPKPKLPPANPPIAVDLVDAKSLVSAAPDAVQQASAPPAPSEAPAEPETPTPPAQKPDSRKAAQAPSDKPTPTTPRQSRLGSSLASQLSRAASRESANPGTGRGTAAQGSGTPAARTAAQLEASFIQALFSQIKRYWRAPTGVDAELLRTSLVVTLRPDGSVGSITIKSQSGENENNANLKALHAERAASAIRRAAPFALPPEHYAIWQSMELTFDKRLK
jgi:type IV secretory pathway VirB10-like protein